MSERENFKFSGGVSEKKDVHDSVDKLKQGDFWVSEVFKKYVDKIL